MLTVRRSRQNTTADNLKWQVSNKSVEHLECLFGFVAGNHVTGALHRQEGNTFELLHITGDLIVSIVVLNA